MSCPYLGRCKRGPNSCYRCADLSLLSLPEDKTRKQRQRKAATLKTTNAYKKAPSHRQLEMETAAELSAVPAAVEMETRRNPGSGNVDGRPGDNLDDILALEDKERTPQGGVKSIAVQKVWLEKTISEFKGTGKFPAVSFRFKGDDEKFVFMSFQTLLEMAHTIKYLRTELYNTRERLKELQKQIQQQEGVRS